MSTCLKGLNTTTDPALKGLSQTGGAGVTINTLVIYMLNRDGCGGETRSFSPHSHFENPELLVKSAGIRHCPPP